MQFLTIKNRHKQSDKAQAIVVKKTRKYGQVIEQTCIKTKDNVLITGAHASGKSYWLTRLYKEAGRIWHRKKEVEPLFLSATRPISSWSEGKHFVTWWAFREDLDDDRHWNKLKAYEKQDVLPQYLKETGAVLFIDDAHLLNGNKLKIAQSCVRSASVFVMTASDEGRISPSLRKDVMFSKPQIFRLDSDVAYDATSIFMWLSILVAMGFGAYELAAVLGGLKMLGSGQRATKQN